MTEQELIDRFTYHPPTGDQAERYQKIRDKALEFSLLIRDVTPESDEQKRAIDHIDEATMAANSSIARNE